MYNVKNIAAYGAMRHRAAVMKVPCAQPIFINLYLWMHTGSEICRTSSQSLEQQPITQWWDVQGSYNICGYSLQSAWVLRQILLSNYLLFDLEHCGSKSRWNDLLNLFCESLQLIVLSPAWLWGVGGEWWQRRRSAEGMWDLLQYFPMMEASPTSRNEE